MNVKQGDGKSNVPATKVANRRTKFGRGPRWLLIAGAIVLVTAGVSYGVWRQVRTHILASEQYQVDPAKISMTPPPPWIRSNVKDEVIREASFDGPLSLLESKLTVRVASAFAAHPWIAHVERVSKHFPSGLEVEVAYRRPVAMVEVSDGALPVDAEGIVLPTVDFRPGEADRYPRIGEILTSPAGLVGSLWGDAAVVGAAQIAQTLGNEWHALDLFRITPAGRHPGGRGGVEFAFAVFTRGGTRIDWGLAPGTTASGEPSAADKVARLKKYAAAHGTLDGKSPQRLRFKPNGELEVIPREPLAPLPKPD